MKYIDADKLIAEIKERKKIEGWCEVGKDTADVYYARGFRFACEFVLNTINSLQQEQPPLPSNLDEAAQKVEDYYDVGEEHGYLYCHRGDIKDAFKTGVEFLAVQGVSMEITDETEWADVDTFVHRNCDGTTVIQIRKK